MRFRSAVMLFAFFAALLLVAPAFAQKVRTDYNSMAPFSSYKTFAFKGGKVLHGKDKELLKVNDIMYQRIVNALRTTLNGKGLREVNMDENPDIWVAFYVGVDEKQQVWSSAPVGPAWGYGYGGWGGYWGAGWNQTMVSNWKEGTLVVDLVDSKHDQLAWRAYITAAVEGVNSSKKADKKINKMVKKAFKKYPPKIKH